MASVTASASAISRAAARSRRPGPMPGRATLSADGEDLERAGVAGELHAARRRSRARCRRPTAKTAAAVASQPHRSTSSTETSVAGERGGRAPQDGRGRAAPVGEHQREAVEQRVARTRGRRRLRGGAHGARDVAPARRCSPGARRTARRPRRRGRSRGTAGRRAARASAPRAGAAAARRCRGSGRRRSRRAAGRRGRARARPARRPRAAASSRERRVEARRRAGWPRRPPAAARRGGPGRASGPRRAPGRPPRPRARRGPAPARPTARARPRRPRPARGSPGRGARPGGPGSSSRSVASASARCAAWRSRPRRRAIDGRTHERMTEAHLRADVQQPGARRAAERRAPTPSRSAARHISAGSPTRLRRRDEQQQPRLGRAAPRAAAGSSPRSGPGAASSPGRPNPPGSCAADSPRGSSSSASGLPRVSATMRSRTRSSSRPGDDGRQQGAGVLLVEAREPQLGQAGQLALVARVAHGEHDRHRLRQQPPRDEAEHLRRGAVEPLRVVDAAEQRPLARDLGQQAERGQRDQEAVGRRAGRRPKATRSAARCGSGSASSRAEQRRAELMQARERQLHLGLDAGDLRDPEAGRLPGRRSAAAPSCPRPPRRGRPAPRSGRRARSPGARRAARARRLGPGTPAGGGRPCANPNRLVRHCQAGSGCAPLRCPRHRPAGPSRGSASGRPRPRPRAARGR